ncbi:MAG: glycosyltransferase [Rhodobacteraceae bacterium]|nr:glycosyltransferase [Paracoccaceae bacterium]
MTPPPTDKAPQRVLHLHFGTDGGAERFFVNLVNAFGERGLQQRFIIRPQRPWRKEIAHLGPITEHHYRLLSLSSLGLHRHVRRLCHTWQPDVIMGWRPRFASRLIPRNTHALRITRLSNFPPHLRHFGTTDVIVSLSPPVYDACQQLGWRKPNVVIANFARSVAPKPVQRQDFGTPADAFLVCGVGRLVSHKGWDLLIRAVARLPDAWLWLVGDGPERAKLEALAQSEGIETRTRFIGWMEEPIHYMAAASAFAFPTRHEALGNVVLEAWKAQVPIVATRTDGPSWSIEDGKSGLLVDIDDLDGFHAALVRLADNPALAQRLVVGGTARLKSRFSKKAIVDQYIALFSGDLPEPMAQPSR